jgi:mono/diheme cytochrome c family protein
MKKPQPIRLTIATAYLLLFATGIYAISIACGPPERSRAAQADRGQALYEEHCINCHGEGGDNPQKGELEVMPADLTSIMSSRGVAEFPIAEIARIIDGRKLVKGHAAEGREMPLWGDVFAQEEGLDDDQIRGKMAEIVAYLMEIQDSE